jgi:hypothetical protein
MDHVERMGQTRNIQLGSQNLKNTDRLKDLSADGRIILNLCQMKCYWENWDRVRPARVREQWWDLVNTVRNLGVTENEGNF